MKKLLINRETWNNMITFTPTIGIGLTNNLLTLVLCFTDVLPSIFRVNTFTLFITLLY